MRTSLRRFSSAVASVIVSSTAVAQSTAPAARTIITAGRPLTPPEIVSVLIATREAIFGKFVRFAYTPTSPGILVLMASDGRPTLMRAEDGYDSAVGHVDRITLTHYTRQPARSCDGKSLGAELVIEYEHKSTDDRWTASARTRTDHDVLAPIFNMLSGGIPLESGNVDRAARAFTAPWTLPAGAQAADPELQARMRQSLWIDTTSLLPLRWSVAVPADPSRGIPALPAYGMLFNYVAAADLRPPDGVAAPACVR